MGAWGLGIFENDDALDWVANLRNANDTEVLKNIFHERIANRNEPNLFRESALLAASEIIAHAKGRGDEDLPDEAQEFLKRVEIKEVTALTAEAARATESILKQSELKELWEESSAGDEWTQMVGELLMRLQS